MKETAHKQRQDKTREAVAGINSACLASALSSRKLPCQGSYTVFVAGISLLLSLQPLVYTEQ